VFGCCSILDSSSITVMGKWRPLDVIVLILSLTVCGLLITSVVDIIINDVDTTDVQSDNILSLVLALTTIINGYVVSTLQSSNLIKEEKK